MGMLNSTEIGNKYINEPGFTQIPELVYKMNLND